MSINNLAEAITILRPNIIAHLNLYRVNHPCEMPMLPGALTTTKEELRALAFVISEIQLQSERARINAALMMEAGDKMDELRRERDSAREELDRRDNESRAMEE